jgi:hypothetical protein
VWGRNRRSLTTGDSLAQTYDCPLGFHWMSTAEARATFVGRDMLGGAEDEPLAYFDQCGWRGYDWGGSERILFRLSDSKVSCLIHQR